jgi:hypothetical protein
MDHWRRLQYDSHTGGKKGREKVLGTGQFKIPGNHRSPQTG